MVESTRPRSPLARFSLATMMIVNAAVGAATALYIQASRAPSPLSTFGPSVGPTLGGLLLAAVVLSVLGIGALRRPTLNGMLAQVAATSALILSYFWFADVRIWLSACFAPSIIVPLLLKGLILEEMTPGPRRDRLLEIASSVLASATNLIVALLIYWIFLVSIVLYKG